MCSKVILLKKRGVNCVAMFINIGFVIKAKDKAHWQKLFAHFCSRAANEEEELAHKLLGEKFRVSCHEFIFV